MIKNKAVIQGILINSAFLLCCAWLIFFIFVASSHEYQWAWMMMYTDVDLSNHDKQWLRQTASVRSEHYVIFLFHFAFSCFIFLRKWNPVFIISFGLIFCYATYAFIFRDMILMSVLR